MRYVFDIDGVICTNSSGDYESAKPLENRIRLINELFDEGHTITLHTARGMGTYENNARMAKARWQNLTISQLKQWGVQYHEIFFGKPAGDVYVDDKALSDKEFFNSQSIE